MYLANIGDFNWEVGGAYNLSEFSDLEKLNALKGPTPIFPVKNVSLSFF